MIVRGTRFKPERPDECSLVLRIYGTKEVFRGPGGRLRPEPGSWELVREVRSEIRRGTYVMPDFELELTGPGGWRFYDEVRVTRDGRELWHPDQEMIFPRELVAECGGEVGYVTLHLYNLERRGVIAPGQRHL